jgi:hypothetical protein
MKAKFACLLLAGSIVATGLNAAPFSGPTGMTPFNMFRGSREPSTPIPVKVTYDAKRGKYCVTKGRALTGSHLAPTICRTAAAWNASGALQHPIS